MESKKQNKNRLIDTENEQVLPEGEEGWERKEIGGEGWGTSFQFLNIWVLGMTSTVWGIQSVTMQYLFMVTDYIYTYSGDHFEMFRNIELLCCITELT